MLGNSNKVTPGNFSCSLSSEGASETPGVSSTMEHGIPGNSTRPHIYRYKQGCIYARNLSSGNTNLCCVKFSLKEHVLTVSMFGTLSTITCTFTLDVSLSPVGKQCSNVTVFRPNKRTLDLIWGHGGWLWHFWLWVCFSPQRKPAVLRGVDLGPCLQKWTVEYLRQRGSDKEVKIHVSTVPQMDFLRKNFVYKWAPSLTHAHRNGECTETNRVSAALFFHRTLPFNEFVKRASESKHSDFFLCEVMVIIKMIMKILCIVYILVFVIESECYCRMRATTFARWERTCAR